MLICGGQIWPQTTVPPTNPDEGRLLQTLSALPADQLASIPQLLLENAPAANEHFWKSLIASGTTAREQRDFARSLFYFAVARQVAQKISNQTLEGLALYQTGLTTTYQWQLDKAIEVYLQSSVLLKQAQANQHLVYVMADLGALYCYQQNYAAAKEYSAQSLALARQLSPEIRAATPRPDGVATALANLGAVARWKGDYQNALDYLRQALEQFQLLARSNPDFRVQAAQMQVEIGRVYRVEGDYVQALVAFNEALVTARTVKERNVLGDMLNSVGLLYLEQRDYQQAVSLFQQSLTINREVKDERNISLNLLNLGVTLYRQARYTEALAALREGYDICERIKFADGVLAAGAVIGTVLRLQGQLTAAQEWLTKSLALAEKANDQNRLAEVFWQQGETFLAASQTTAALAAGNRALEIAKRNRIANLVYLSAIVMGKAYFAQQNYEQAKLYFTQAIQQIEDLRWQVAGVESSSVTFFGDKVEPYQQMAALLVAQNKPLEALLYAERAKGRVLLDVMRGGHNNLKAYLAPSEQAELARLQSNISQLAEQAGLSDTAARLAAARLNYEAYQNDLYTAHPEAQRRRGLTTPLTPDDLAQMVPVGTAYLEYVITPERAYLFTILRPDREAPPQVSVVRLNVTASALAAQTGQLHDRVAGRSPLAPASARALYNVLLAPVAQQLAGVESVLIVPDGCLWNVPFQALLNGEGKYLLEDYAISYAPSLSILREMKQKPARSRVVPNATLLAFGNPLLTVTATAAAPKDEDCPLPGAEQEVAALAALVGSNHSQVFTGGKASEAAFRASAASYRTLHFATHGILDNQHPLYSYLRLARTGPAPDSDGRLEAREIMEMSLDADLAVLSACHTADGKISAGEGVIGMSWAFFVAGCRTTVVSQWAVNSEATSAFMEHFYRGLSNGQTKAKALRTASLAIRQEARYRHPFYWAGFVAIGSPD